MADDDDEDEVDDGDEQASGSSNSGSDEEDDEEAEAGENGDASMEGATSPGKKMTARQQEKATEKKMKAAQRSAKKVRTLNLFARYNCSCLNGMSVSACARSIVHLAGTKTRAKEQPRQTQRKRALEEGLLCFGSLFRSLTLTTLVYTQAADSIKRFSYLLGQTELFRHFIDLKVGGKIRLANLVVESTDTQTVYLILWRTQKGRDPEFANLLEESEKALAIKKNGGKKGNARTRKSEKQEDAELVAEGDAEDDTFVFTESPPCG
jgi:hypothetical protein